MPSVIVEKCVSTYLSLNKNDWFKAFKVGFGTSVLATVGQWIASQTIPTFGEIKVALIAGVSAGITYLYKQLMSGPKKESAEDVEKGN